MKFRSYPSYRASDAPWIDSVPSDWRTVRFSSVYKESKVSNKGMVEDNLLSLSYGQIVRKDIESTDGLLPASFETYQVVEKDDLIFRFTDLQNDKRSLRSGLVPERGIITSAYVAATPIGVDPVFGAQLLRSYDTAKVFYGLGGGLRQSVKFQDISRLPVHLPSRSEQRAIADFLDHDTARIDTLIEKQQRLVEVLRERREVVIRTLLRVGLDPNVEVKESGVTGLGRVPRHWEIVQARHLCTITTGGEDSGNATEDGAYPFFVRGREVLRMNKYSYDCEAVMTPGDGQGGTGKVFHYYVGKFEAHQRVYIFMDFAPRIRGRYFYHFLAAYLRHIALAGSNTVTMESLRRPVLAGFRVAVPPLEEQDEILAQLDEQTAKIDALIEKAIRFIELAKERRSALITAAVTGQIDVRGEVA